ncbi:hypothetical protein TIFTF001_046461 [Ficus carica]|uniref:Uncharacterized protein n=1 Tax=Ficus carica TaxID=3494 RepID=A0AA87ZQ49_FICCA|nr:hypothetical protein TIFTF001_046460 [Ficus carica]GMN30898.1 hypothetical protein TIFTF001_046461 [Ficus carica]
MGAPARLVGVGRADGNVVTKAASAGTELVWMGLCLVGCSADGLAGQLVVPAAELVGLNSLTGLKPGGASCWTGEARLWLKWGRLVVGWQWLVQYGEDGLAWFRGWTGWSASGAKGWAGLARWLGLGWWVVPAAGRRLRELGWSATMVDC